jgi:zinc protease
MPTNSSLPTLSSRDVRRTVLPNGLVVLTRETHVSPTVSTMLWYRVGSRNEQPGETGRSHFLEHMQFKGTDRYAKGEIDLLTMKNGGSNNAFTSYDFTAYYFNFASDRWETAIDIESDRMTHTIFDPAEYEAEKKVVVEELQAGLDQPWGYLMQELNATAFERHAYRNPVIGWQPDLESATREGMEAYYRRHYHPANATLVITGDFDSDAALEKVYEAFGPIPAIPVQTAEPPAEPEQEAERRITLRWRSDIPRLAIAYHAPRIADPDSYALQVLAAILGEGKASRLYQRLVERERATTFASAEYGESRDPTLFYIRAESGGAVEPEAIEASIDDELARIMSDGVSSEEVNRAKHQIEAHFVFSMEKTLDQAMLFGQIETLGGLEYIDSYLPLIQEVDVEAVADVCRRYVSKRNRTVGWLLGDDGPEPAS